jgi:hypothetical protein
MTLICLVAFLISALAVHGSKTLIDFWLKAEVLNYKGYLNNFLGQWGFQLI